MFAKTAVALLSLSLASASPVILQNQKRDSNFTYPPPLPPLNVAFPANSAALNSTVPICREVYKTLTITTENSFYPISTFGCQGEVSSLFVDFASDNSNFTTEYPVTLKNVTGDYNIYMVYCEPAGGVTKAPALVLTHGIGFSAEYWNFTPSSGVNGYNFAQAAAGQGYATLAYDRLGVRNSQRPDDSINITQAATEVGIANAIGQGLRDGSLLDGVSSYSSVVGVGHSFGSEISTGVAGTHPSTFDAIVLTGFTTFAGGFPATIQGLAIGIASEVDPVKYPADKFNNGYLASNIYSLRNLFLFGNSYRGVGYDEFVFQDGAAISQSFSAAEFLTLTNPTMTNTAAYTGDVLVVTGDHDYIYCGGGCVNNGTDLLAEVKTLFPGAASFETYMPEQMGHGVNFHYSTPLAYAKIFSFLAAHGH